MATPTARNLLAAIGGGYTTAEANLPWCVIAASGAPAKVKALADYLCDGTADQTEINTALAVDDKRPILLVGPTFTTTAAIAFTDGIRHDLHGWNEDQVTIIANHTGNAFEMHSASTPFDWRVTVGNLYIQKGASTPARGVSIVNGASIRFENIHVKYPTTGIRGYFANSNVFSDCIVTDCTTGLTLTGASNQGSHKNTFRTCRFAANAVNTLIDTFAQSNVFDACIYNGTDTQVGIQYSAAADNVENNVWRDCWIEEDSGTFIPFDLQGGDQITIERPFFAMGNHPPIKVSGFGATNVRVIDPDPFTPAKWGSIPDGPVIVRSAGVDEANVVAFGADPTGTMECALNIQAAIDSLGLAGGRVTGPRGTYLLGKHARTGLGSLYCVYVDDTVGPIELDFPQGTVFTAAAGAGSGDSFLLFAGASGTRTDPSVMRGITIDGDSDTIHSPVLVGDANNVTITECTFLGYEGSAIYVSGRGNHCMIVNNVFFPSTSVVASTGPRIEGPANVVANNQIFMGTSAASGIVIANNADISLFAEEVSVVGNIITGGMVGISLAGCSRVVVADNTIRNQTNVSSTAAIRTEPYTNVSFGTFSVWDCTIANNVIFNCRNGIDLFGDATYGTIRCLVTGNRIVEGPGVNLATGFQIRGAASDFNEIHNNLVVGATTPFAFVGANDRRSGNRASSGSITSAGSITYRDENSGTATLVSGNTTVVVTHNLGRTPTADQVAVWPTANWGSMNEFWVDTLTSTQFTINADANPAENVTFGWRAWNLP
jgi:hypothetical protein